MDDIRDFGSYRIKIAPGTIPSLILSFAGIGRPKEDLMAFEWEGAFKEMNRPEHIIYIQDTARSWFNDMAGLDALVSFLTRYASDNGVLHTTAIGLSMGANGAILLSRQMKIDRITAMSPQMVVGNGVNTFDRRFADLWEKIETVHVPHLVLAIDEKTSIDFVIALDDVIDLVHMETLMASQHRLANVRILGVRGDHNIGQSFKRLGRLTELVDFAIGGDVSIYPDYFADITGDVCAVAAIAARKSSASEDVERICALAKAHPRLLPNILLPVVASKGEARGETVALPVDGDQAVVQVNRIFRDVDFNHSLGQGWARPTAHGAWSLGESHSLRLTVFDFESFDEVYCRVSFKPFLARPEMRRRLRFETRDGWTKEIVATFEKDADRIFTLSIPCKGRFVDIRIETPDHTSPALVGLSEDPRSLGILLSSVGVFSRQ